MQRQRRHREAEMSRSVISARLLSGDLLGCRLRVKMRNTHPEEMSSALPPNPDIARRGRHFAFVPRTVHREREASFGRHGRFRASGMSSTQQKNVLT
jgi:hypothetical protein